MTDNKPSIDAENDQDLPKKSDPKLSDIETYVQDFPIKQLNLLDNAGRFLIRFGYGSIVLISPITNSRNVRFDPSLFNQSPDRVLTSLYETIELDDSTGEYKFLTEFLTGTRREGMSQWINEAKAWIAENVDLVEKEKQLEIERLERELQDAVPITVRNVVQLSVQKEKVIVIGRIKKRSSPVTSTRKELEYTAYDLELEDIDETSSRIPVNDLPAGDYDNGDLIVIQGIITQTLRRGKAFKEIDGLDFRIEQPKFVPSDPLERVWRPLIFDFYESKRPEYSAMMDVIAEISDKNPEASKIIDPKNRRKYTMEETNPKRLNKICCERRSSDRGYLEKGPKKTPLNYRWVKKAEYEDKT